MSTSPAIATLRAAAAALEAQAAGLRRQADELERQPDPSALALESYIGVPQAAERLGISDETIYRLVYAGTLPAKRLAGRIVIPESALAGWVARAPAAGAAAPLGAVREMRRRRA